MWKIRNLKQAAKPLLKNNYWPCVFTTAVFAIITYINTGNSLSHIQKTAAQGLTSADFLGPEGPALAGAIFAGFKLTVLVFVLLRVFLYNPIKVGYSRFLLNCGNQSKFGDMFLFLRGIYVSCGWKMFCTDLFTDLWYLLLIVPGIIKTYSWRLVPYILAENPFMSGTEARRRSAELMHGHKWHSFGMDMSFIGWYILSAVTVGLVGTLYSDPYRNLTECELYRTLRK